MFKHRIKLCAIICLLGFVSETGMAATEGIALGLTTYNDYAPNSVQRLIYRKVDQKKYKEALAIIDLELQKNPKNTELLYHKAAIYADLEQYDKSMDALRQIEMLQPHNEKANKLREKIVILQKTVPHNELGFSQDEAYVSDLESFWSYSSLHYYRFTDVGTFGARINHANRFGIGGQQYLVEAYPKLMQYGYLSLIFGYSGTSQRVYPKYQYTIEPYFNLPNNFELSLGQRYLRSFGQNIYTYTGSLGHYFSDYFIWIRPYHYTPRSANFVELGLTRYFIDRDTYLTLKGGAGRVPDIGDVPPFDRIIILRTTSIGLNGQLPVAKCLFLQGGAGYVRQVFDSGKVRKITDGFLGIIWRF